MRWLWAATCLAAVVMGKKDPAECEVCRGVLDRAVKDLSDADFKDHTRIAEKIREVCGGTKNKENKFCFYIGALPESATSIMNDVSKPLSFHKPVAKVCESLKSKDAQICELKYDKPIDWKTVDFNKMRVKELKKILDDWGEKCKGCTEKSEYVKMVKDLMPKHVPKAEL